MSSVRFTRRGLLLSAAFATLVLSVSLVPSFANAQSDKPHEWVVGYVAGSGSDAVARTVAEEMSKSLGRTIVVDKVKELVADSKRCRSCSEVTSPDLLAPVSSAAEQTADS